MVARMLSDGAWLGAPGLTMKLHDGAHEAPASEPPAPACSPSLGVVSTCCFLRLAMGANSAFPISQELCLESI